MRRKLISVCFCMIITELLITGCGSQKKEQAEYGNAKVEDTEGTKGEKEDSETMITIGFVQSGEISDWRTAMTASMNDTFREANGYTLKLEDAGEGYDKQFAAVRKLVKEKVDYLVISTLLEEENASDPVQYKSQWEEVLTEAKEAEIPVILAGNEPSVQEESLYSAWIGSDYLQQGYDAAGWLEEYLEKSGKTEEDIRIAWIADPQDSVKEARMEGFCEWKELAGLEHWTLWDQQGRDNQKIPEAAQEESFLISTDTAKKMIKKNQKMDVIVCEQDSIAIDMIKEAEKAGKACGAEGIIVISFGGGKAALQEVMDGKILADMECSPFYGPCAEEIVKRLETGQEVDKMQYLTEKVFTAENAGNAIEKRNY